MANNRKIRVAVLYGGKSGEHEVSLQSARSIIQAMDPDKYEILPVGITREGKWLRGEESIRLLGSGESVSLLHAEETTKAIIHKDQPFPSVFHEEIDVVFPVLHGPNGEDGTIQGMLELADIPYVGAGVLASAAGMDKVIMKRLFAQAGLPQAEFLVFLRKEIEEDVEKAAMEAEERFGYPNFVKPANLGSSVGISKARNREELKAALQLACKYDRKILVEEFVPAREIEVAVLGNDAPIASVPGEIVSSNEFYDYRAKYIDGKSRMIIPAELTDEQVKEFQSLAIQAFRAIDGAGLARVDFFLRKDDGRIYINEINTMPGFTKYSMYPLLWQHTGISYPELIDRLINLALERYQEKKKSVTDLTI